MFLLRSMQYGYLLRNMIVVISYNGFTFILSCEQKAIRESATLNRGENA